MNPMEQLSEKEREIEYLKRIIQAYEKVNQMMNYELLDAQATIQAHQRIAKISHEELQKARNEINELKSRESLFKQEILQILNDNISSEELILEKIDILSKKSEKGFFSDLFNVIASLDIPEEEASHLWNQILAHSQNMSQRIGRPIGFRVAMLDYFTNKKKLIKNPKIIEVDKFEEVIKHSIIDELTGVYNRRYFNITLQREIKRAGRYSQNLCLFVFDIDNFKKYNDTYGHSEGDKVLQLVGKSLLKTFRAEDTACRIGGEEFAVILPETDTESAFKACLRFSKKLKEISEYALPSTITISGGISCYSKTEDQIEDFYIRADELSYKAKRSGKDRICI
jgi:diguanylate cyclase (GGDEF)-like protein